MAKRWLVAAAIVLSIGIYVQAPERDAPGEQALAAREMAVNLEAGESDDASASGAPAIAPLSAAQVQETASPLATRLSDRVTGTQLERERGLAALEGLRYRWSELLPLWTIEFKAPNEDLFGLTHTQEMRIEIFVRADQTEEMLQHVIAHELGHAVDVTLNDGDDRRRWQEARGIEDKDWWPGSGATDFATGAGDFAESFAAWQVGPEDFRSELGDAPSVRSLDLLALLASG